jgi:hypothetical protein
MNPSVWSFDDVYSSGQVGRQIRGEGNADPVGSDGAKKYSEAVTELGWPNRVERLTVPAGTLVLTHFDVFHRGTHGPIEGQPHRLMLKLWYVRGQDNTDGPSWEHTPADDDQMPRLFRESRPPAADVEGQEVIWDNMWRWMLGAPPPAAGIDLTTVAMLREPQHDLILWFTGRSTHPSDPWIVYPCAIAQA